MHHVVWYGLRVGIMGNRQTGFGDLGLLSSGHCEKLPADSKDTPYCQPPVNTPFRPYFALRMLSSIVRPGAKLVAAQASDPLVGVHASQRADGSLAVMLINKDPARAREVTLDLSRVKTGAKGQALFYGPESTDIERRNITFARTQTLSPYSMTTMIFRADRRRPTP